MKITQKKDHHAPSKHLRQKAKPGLWIKDTNLRSHYELNAFWNTLKFEATLPSNSQKPSH